MNGKKPAKENVLLPKERRGIKQSITVSSQTQTDIYDPMGSSCPGLTPAAEAK